MKTIIRAVLLIACVTVIVHLYMAKSAFSRTMDYDAIRAQVCYGEPVYLCLGILLLLYLLVFSRICVNTWHDPWLAVFFVLFTAVDFILARTMMEPTSFRHSYYNISVGKAITMEWQYRIIPIIVVTSAHILVYFLSIDFPKHQREMQRAFRLSIDVKVHLRKLQTPPAKLWHYVTTILGLTVYNYLAATAFFVKWGRIGWIE